MEEKKKRYTLLDTLRGFSLLSMILYHAAWDCAYIFGMASQWSWFRSAGAYIWQQSICWTFILLSGFCWSLGRHQLKRALIVLAASAVISLVTVFFIPDCTILFGVLSLIGTGMLALIPLDKFLQKLHPILGALLAFVLFILTRNTGNGTLGFEGWHLMELPQLLYQNLFTAYLGFPTPEFYSCDYFPLIPWIFLYLTGYFLFHLFRKYDLLRHLSCISCPPLDFLGRHSLVVYVLHQPVVYGILFVIFSLI